MHTGKGLQAVLHGSVPKKEIPIIGAKLVTRSRASIIVRSLAGREHCVLVSSDVDLRMLSTTRQKQMLEQQEWYDLPLDGRDPSCFDPSDRSI